MGQSKSSNPFNASVPVPAVQSNRSVSYQISQNLPNFTISTKFYNFDQISLQIFPSLRSASVTAVRKFHRRVAHLSRLVSLSNVWSKTPVYSVDSSQSKFDSYLSQAGSTNTVQKWERLRDFIESA